MEDLKESRHRILLAHEQTRKAVANLLHAQVQSRLLVLEYWLKDCQELLTDEHPEVLGRLKNARSILGEIIEHDLRSIIRHLYPSIIRIGLPSALNSLAERFQGIFEVTIDIDETISEIESSMSSGLSVELRLSLYRVVEEALTNVAKHSQASKVLICLGFSSDTEIYLTIEDDGRGFIPSEALLGDGHLSMEDYVEALDGRLLVDSTPGQGTKVSAWVPISESERELAEA